MKSNFFNGIRAYPALLLLLLNLELYIYEELVVFFVFDFWLFHTIDDVFGRCLSPNAPLFLKIKILLWHLKCVYTIFFLPKANIISIRNKPYLPNRRPIPTRILSSLPFFFFYHTKTKLQNRDEGGYEAQSGGNPMGRPISYPRHTTFTFRVINDLKQKLRILVHSLCSHKQT